MNYEGVGRSGTPMNLGIVAAVRAGTALRGWEKSWVEGFTADLDSHNTKLHGRARRGNTSVSADSNRRVQDGRPWVY